MQATRLIGCLAVALLANLTEVMTDAAWSRMEQGAARLQEGIESAFAALERADLALCPDRDGGYNLIALRAPCDALFALEMSTESVLEQTRKQAERLGLRCELLPPHHDVDLIEDLERIRSEVSVELTPRTFAWLQRA